MYCYEYFYRRCGSTVGSSRTSLPCWRGKWQRCFKKRRRTRKVRKKKVKISRRDF